jgi:hypothetical protein
METREILGTGAAALLFAATFMLGGHLHPLRWILRDERNLASFGGGVASAYVFIHVMPEMHESRRALAASASFPLRFEGMFVYFVALVGFLAFYGLDHLRKRLRKAKAANGPNAFGIEIGGYAAYVFLMSYLLIHGLADNGASAGLNAVAISFHFLALDHALHSEHGERYRNVGRYLLAGAACSGWATAVLLALPPLVLPLLVAFISGAIMMNSMIMELPNRKEGRFLAFAAGGVVYGLLLIPLG